MSHGHHDLPRRIFGDDCEECVGRASTIVGLAALDSINIKKLGDLALEFHANPGTEDQPQELGASFADVRAVGNLRLAARIVFASGIDEEVAR